MSEQYRAPKLELTFDENRLVRLFRCLDSLGRSSLLNDLHLKLMKSHSVDPLIAKVSNAAQAIADELEEPPDERLLCAQPCETLIAGAHDFDIPLAEIAWGGEYAEWLLGAEETQDDWTVKSLVEAYVQSMDELGYDPCVNLNSEDDQQFAREEAAEYIRFWRARIVEGIEASVRYQSKKK
jgi:hypothetical protein